MLTLKKNTVLILLLFVLASSNPVAAHFGMVIPSDSTVMQNDPRKVNITLSFSHPMEMIGMDLMKPETFKVTIDGRHIDLIQQLQSTKVMGRQAWEADYTIRRPGIYIFHMAPQPYWEPTEDCFIVHHTKTVVSAFGDDQGWDAEVGLKTEIVPLSKPFGLYAGNIFQGVVKLNGKPVPYSTVEVEFYNQDGTAQAPTDDMITQTLKADGSGVFAYAVPAAGWWGFAALNTSDQKIKHQGKEKDVELGAVIWVKFHPWQKASGSH